MVLAKACPVVAMGIHIAHLFGRFGQHALVQIGAFAGHAGHDFVFTADRRQIKGSDFAGLILLLIA